MTRIMMVVGAAACLSGCAGMAPSGANAGCSQLELSLGIRGSLCGQYSNNQLARIKRSQESDDRR